VEAFTPNCASGFDGDVVTLVGERLGEPRHLREQQGLAACENDMPWAGLAKAHQFVE
jgi:hypothetical protein